MGKNRILGHSHLTFCFILSVFIYACDSQDEAFDTSTLSSFSYATTRLNPYEWRYIRVDLPPWFSSISFALQSDANLDLHKIKSVSPSSLQIICFREGSLPLPDVYNASVMGLVMDYISNSSFSGTRSLQNIEKCYPMQKNLWLRVTNEQISPGTWYFGIFNGIGHVRTQSKMIDRGSALSFSGNLSVEGCMTSMMLGQFCNQTVYMLPCKSGHNLTGIGLDNELYRKLENSVLACRNANGIVCHEGGEQKIYLLDIIGIVEELLIAVTNVTFDRSQPSTINGSQSLMCYARNGAVPLETVYDFSIDISKEPLVIHFPKAGRWFFIVRQIDTLNTSRGPQSRSLKVCYLLEWQVLECPAAKAGLNCTLEKYMLQAIVRTNPSVPFESNYIPISEKISSTSANFPLEPLTSNISHAENSEEAWTFFLLDIPAGAAGGNIHVHLASDGKINYEIYARYEGLPSLSSWDYFYANKTVNSNDSMFFKLYDSTVKTISFYMLYVKVGTWSFGLRKLDPANSTTRTDISISIERCPHKCSYHGTCRSVLDASGLTLYSYCFCDRNHGGFDCSVEIVSHQGHLRQSIFLIASNAAALFPAYWALRNRAFPEWVLFTSSGLASAVYHACDVGAGCLLTFRVLQFFDFWLSFMAVVSTFVYLTSISDAWKRTIFIVVALLTALLAQTKPTQSRNIGYVMGLGALGLLVGWLVEFFARNRTFPFSREFSFNFLYRWESVKGWIRNTIKIIIRRFRWGFIAAGVITLALASLGWRMETTANYWIWHSLWHIFIYTSSFFFLCSKPRVQNQQASNGRYELTHQNSLNNHQQHSPR
ncbi:uncharacterized protein LOC127248165 isoform X2 [Andrographis paniculata]|uniref:uncharacterized protein LOC127248165 isoform X2 n=1 Tax=Andrographis paniculata TaxID=175694 RepID=UPI0021E85D99|nr:uncharacterized protein LOC127248165 isoform X2 [Andrographis paniculata]